MNQISTDWDLFDDLYEAGAVIPGWIRCLSCGHRWDEHTATPPYTGLESCVGGMGEDGEYPHCPCHEYQ